MADDVPDQVRTNARELRSAKEIEGHVSWLDTFTPAALCVLALASGIYTYLGVSSLLDGSGSTVFLAAIAYSVAVSVGIFVFWSYILRLLPAMRTAGGFLGLTAATILGSLAIVAMSSWLNAAALAGSAAVEQHLKLTIQSYQTALERSNEIAQSGQGLRREVARAAQSFENLAEQESSGALSGVSGRGAVFTLLNQKRDELRSLEAQIVDQSAPIAEAYETGNRILTRMRELMVQQGPIEDRSVAFSEEAVRLAGVLTTLRQLQVAQLVARAANDLPASVVLPELDGRSAQVRSDQEATMKAILDTLNLRAGTLEKAAQQVLSLEQPPDITYTPISAADAVIRYAGDFAPSWAGAIAIDLLPGVLVFVLAVAQAAIRRGREGAGQEESLTLADLRIAMRALNDIEASMSAAEARVAERTRPHPPGPAERPETPIRSVRD
ncbi:MAG: hypothetical protein AAFV19_14645 [Pseudomonadota bacterium]